MLSRVDPSARRFLARLPLAAGLALLVWFGGLASPWGRAVTAVSEKAIRLVERPSVTFLQWEDGNVLFRRSDFSSRSGTPGFEAGGVTGNLVLLLALAAATPGCGTGRGLARAGLAGTALFATHVLHFALTVQATYAVDLGAWSLYAYPRWERELLATGRYFFDVALKYALPFFLWGLLVVLPILNERAEAEAGAGGAAAPAPSPRRRHRR